MSDVVERVLSLSRADGCIVLLSESSSVDLRWATNNLTTNGSHLERSLTVVSVVGSSVGTRSASAFDDLEGLVRASEQAARDAAPAEDAQPLVDGPADADFSTVAQATSTEVFASLAAGLGESFAAARTDGLRQFGFASHGVTTTWLGSSTGLRRRHVQPRGYVELTAKDDSPGGSSWVGQHTRDWSDIRVPDLDAELRRRLRWGRRNVDVPAGRYETILPPSAVADLLVYAFWSAAGRDAAEGRTVYSRPGGGTRVGEALAPAGFSMRSDPHDADLATMPFVVAGGSSSMSSVFDNGLELSATDWVSDGHLSALTQTRSSAATSGSPVTPFIDNLIVDGGGTKSVDELVAGTERGLLLTCLWYIREVDPESLLLTGLTRDGVYLVEGGEVTGAVTNFRWN
ncbi:MAG: TldD/PmbA family protein, partial [Pseudorhodobacter sp.]|nr:TldD/PmbA family protein [Frankiaceae bacterium]